MSKLILASASPRRKELLAGLGLEFTIWPSSIKEPDYSGEDPTAYAKVLAEAKASSVASQVKNGLVIGADTIVVLGNRVLGKPEDLEAAREMLTELSGQTNTVYTGIAVVNAQTGELVSDVAATEVKFYQLSTGEIEAYLASGEPFDKAGAYGIQGLGSLLVERIDGCYFNVVGLPLSALNRLLKRFDLAVLDKERIEDQRTKRS